MTDQPVVLATGWDDGNRTRNIWSSASTKGKRRRCPPTSSIGKMRSSVHRTGCPQATGVRRATTRRSRHRATILEVIGRPEGCVPSAPMLGSIVANRTNGTFIHTRLRGPTRAIGVPHHRTHRHHENGLAGDDLPCPPVGHHAHRRTSLLPSWSSATSTSARPANIGHASPTADSSTQPVLTMPCR